MKSARHPKRRAPRERRDMTSASRDRYPSNEAGSASFTATEAKNEFGQILEKAIHGTTVVITKHDRPKAVLISVDQFNALKHAPENSMEELSREFDVLLASMQSDKARAGMKTAFRASPQQLGKAAVAAARKRG
jgi:antitoxin Phd